VDGYKRNDYDWLKYVFYLTLVVQSIFKEDTLPKDLITAIDQVFLMIYIVHILKGDIRRNQLEVSGPSQLWHSMHVSVLNLSKHWDNELFVQQL
jgi:hypothetical protein